MLELQLAFGFPKPRLQKAKSCLANIIVPYLNLQLHIKIY